MLQFYLTEKKEEYTNYLVEKLGHNEVTDCKEYRVVRDDETPKMNCYKVQARKIGTNMVYLHINDSYLIESSLIFAIVANEISNINKSEIIPINMCLNSNTAVVFYGENK